MATRINVFTGQPISTGIIIINGYSPTTLTGLLKGSGGFTAAATDQDVTGYALTGYVAGSSTGSLVATDTMLQAFTKLQNSVGLLADGIVLKGNIDCSTNPNYPAADAGFAYYCTVAGKIGGASGKSVDVGDLIICKVDGSVTGDEALVGANWFVLEHSDPSNPVTDEIHVAKNGNDTNGNGSINKPYLTVQKAFNVIPASSHVRIVVHPGEYTETFTLTHNKTCLLDLKNAKLIGAFTWNVPEATTHEPKLIVQGYDLRGYYPSGTYIDNCIEGNVLIAQNMASSRYTALHLIDSGIIGNIDFTNIGTTACLTHLFCHSGGFTGTATTSDGNCTVSVYAWDCNTSGSMNLGGFNGKFLPNVLSDVETKQWTITAGFAGGLNGRIVNTVFGASSNFAGITSGTLNLDANSYDSYNTRVTTKGSETILRIDKSSGVLNESTVTGTTVTDALNNLGTLYYPFVTVGATGADYTSLNSAIDFCATKGGGTIQIIDEIYNYSTGGVAKDVSNITFTSRSGDWVAGGSMIFWNSGAGAWTGRNVTFKNLIVRARPGSSGSLLTLNATSHIMMENCWMIIDGSTSPSLATSIVNCNSQICRIYCSNVIMTKSAPGNRTIFTNDTNATFFGLNKTNLSTVTPLAVNLDSSSILQWGTATTTTLIDKASGMANDSTVSGTTVKDALNTLSGLADKTFSLPFVTSSVIAVAHNLGKYPSSIVIDTGGNELIPAIQHTDVNNLTVTLSVATSGTVICN